MSQKTPPSTTNPANAPTAKHQPAPAGSVAKPAAKATGPTAKGAVPTSNAPAKPVLVSKAIPPAGSLTRPIGQVTPGKPPKPNADAAPPIAIKFDASQLQNFIQGSINLADLMGIDLASQEKLARMGYSLMNEGKLDDADKIFTGLLALNPRESYFSLAKGAVAQRRQDWINAAAWYTRTIEIEPNNMAAHANRADVYLAQNKLTDAVRDLIEVIRIDPQSQTPTSLRARALLAEVQRQLQNPQQ